MQRLAGSTVTRLGVLGGTFDPIHIGHLVAASEALHVFALDRILFVPTGQPWQKLRYSDAEDRFLMTTLGAAAHPAFGVSRMELDRKGPTYTADTMRALKDFHQGSVELFFILGADAATKLGTWHRIEELRDLADMIVVTRAGFDVPVEPDPTWPRIHALEMPGIDVSASDIRERVRTGRPIDFLVPRSVEAYIRDQGLYVDAWKGAA